MFLPLPEITLLLAKAQYLLFTMSLKMYFKREQALMKWVEMVTPIVYSLVFREGALSEADITEHTEGYCIASLMGGELSAPDTFIVVKENVA